MPQGPKVAVLRNGAMLKRTTANTNGQVERLKLCGAAAWAQLL